LSKAFNWHDRYRQQVRWTKGLRDFLYPVIQLQSSRRVLEVGCGTGALLEELVASTRAAIFGIDLNREYLSQAYQNASHSQLVQGNALSLPYRAGVFDISLCHFVLLWVKDPEQMVQEMKRVTRPGGYVLAFAEPDYGGRIDYPASLATLGQWQIAALKKQGANPEIGRRLAEIFLQAGFVPVQTGLLGGQWTLPQPPSTWQAEWDTLEADLATIPELVNAELLTQLKQEDHAAHRAGQRILFVPTFYAWGKVV